MAKKRKMPESVKKLLAARKCQNPSAAEVNDQAAVDLYLSAKSDGRLYKRFTHQVIQNYAEKMKAGRYDRKRAVDGLLPGLEQAAKDYARQFDSPGNWSRLFSVATRRAAAEMWLPEIEDAAEYEAERLGSKSRNPGGKKQRARGTRGKPGRGRYFIVQSWISGKKYDLSFGDPSTTIGTGIASANTIKALLRKVPAGEEVFRVYLRRTDGKTGVKRISSKAK